MSYTIHIQLKQQYFCRRSNKVLFVMILSIINILFLGTIIGSGIWVTPGSIMQYSESVGIFLVQWVVCGLLSALGKISNHTERLNQRDS